MIEDERFAFDWHNKCDPCLALEAGSPKEIVIKTGYAQAEKHIRLDQELPSPPRKCTIRVSFPMRRQDPFGTPQDLWVARRAFYDKYVMQHGGCTFDAYWLPDMPRENVPAERDICLVCHGSLGLIGEDKCESSSVKQLPCCKHLIGFECLIPMVEVQDENSRSLKCPFCTTLHTTVPAPSYEDIVAHKLRNETSFMPVVNTPSVILFKIMILLLFPIFEIVNFFNIWFSSDYRGPKSVRQMQAMAVLSSMSRPHQVMVGVIYICVFPLEYLFSLAIALRELRRQAMALP